MAAAAITHITCEYDAICLFFHGDANLPKLVFSYASEAECQAVYAKVRELLDAQPVEDHLAIENQIRNPNA